MWEGVSKMFHTTPEDIKRITFSFINSLGYYLPKHKPLSAYVSDVCAYTSDFANRPENQRLVKRVEYRLYKRKCRLHTWKGVCAWLSSCLDCSEA